MESQRRAPAICAVAVLRGAAACQFRCSYGQAGPGQKPAFLFSQWPNTITVELDEMFRSRLN